MKASLSILIFFSTSALAAGKCDFESVTNKCKMFDPPGNRIQMKDGTFIPKFGVLNDEAQKNTDIDHSQLEKASTLVVESQLDMMKILDEVPTRRLNAKTKFILAGQAALVGGLWHEGFEKWAPSLAKSYLPWPPGDQNPQPKSVDALTLRNELQKILTPSQQQRMKAISEKMMKGSAGTYTATFKAKHSLSDEMTNIKDSRRKRAEELVEFVRGSMIRNIVGTRPENQWSPQELAAVEKIKAITYHAGDNPNVQNAPSCQGIVPNAFYQPVSNTINLCTNFYNFPDATIVAVLGHEMGHAVDPCGCQTHFHKIDKKKLQDLWAKGELPPEVAKDDDLSMIASTLGSVSYGGSTVTAAPFEHFLNDPNKLDYFIKSGILTPGPGQAQSFKQNGNNLEGYFLNDVYRCLLDTTDGSFRQTTLAEVEASADIVVNKRQAVAGENFDPKMEKERIVRAFTRNPQCYSPRSQTQMGEVISDWFGSKALGEFLENEKLESPEERLAPFGFFAGTVCLDRGDLEKPSTTTMGTVKSVRTDLNREAGQHPASIMRLEKVMLADSRVRKAMGCSETIASTCNHNTGGSSSTSGTSGAER